MDERRHFERLAVAVTIDVRYQGTTRVCFAADLSEGGVRLADLPDLESGAEIDLIFHPSDDETIEVSGVIRWVTNSDTGTYSGVEFLNVAETARKRLDEILAEATEPID